MTFRGISSHTTPYELLLDQKPNVNPLRVFGCRCWFNNRAGNQFKLGTRATEVLFNGCARGSKGYELWDSIAETVAISRDVHFYEEKSNYNNDPVLDTVEDLSETNVDDLIFKPENIDKFELENNPRMFSIKSQDTLNAQNDPTDNT